MRIIDIHTHAFPDALAERAMPALEEEGDIKAALDGKLSSLLASMDAAGIERSVVASIATRPEQFDSILKWSKEIASDRIIPFTSVHPADPNAAERIHHTADAGLKGVKFHPYYQEFYLEEPRMNPIYQALQDRALIALVHTGFDLAFERVRRADPVRILDVVKRFPDLKFVATHMGAWEDYDEVERHMSGKPIYTDISFSIQDLPIERARSLVLGYRREYVLFGTDSPWAGQKETVDFVRSLELGPDWEQSIFFDNAARLLAVS